MKKLDHRPQFKPYCYIVALDIETSSKGKLLDIGCYTEDTYRTFPNWTKCFDWLTLVCETKKTSIRVVAHNGFGFDFVNLLPWLLENMDRYDLNPEDINIFSSESLVVGAFINWYGYRIELFDTVRLFTGVSLENLAMDFLGEGKIDIPDQYKSRMETYKAKYSKKYYAYLKRDCESLFKIYISFRDEINTIEPIGELGYSSGSTSFRAFRHYLGRAKPKTFIYALPTDLQYVGEEAMRGGFTSYVGDGVQDGNGFYRDVNAYDVISMYPHAMMYTVTPTCEPEITKKVKLTDDGDIWPGYYLCEYEQTRGRVPIFKPLKETKADEPQWQGTAMLSHEEVQWLKEYGKVKVLEGVYYPEYEQPFRLFIQRMLESKQMAKRAGQNAKSWAYKILANSLYGKFAQRALKQIVAITGDRDWFYSAVKAGSEFTKFYDGSVILYGSEHISSSFSNRFIGAMVTARSRLKLGLVMNTVRTIYCDTDSIFTQDEIDPMFIGSEVGQFELKSDQPKPMLCLGKKLYVYGDDMHAKGVPVQKKRDNKIIRDGINLDDFITISHGETVSVPYRTPTALKTALKNKAEFPNEFLLRHRKIRAFPSMFDKGLIDEEEDFLDSRRVHKFLKKYHLI